MALKNRSIQGQLLFHSDRGVQYACTEFQTQLKGLPVIQSMSRKGNCWDNAVAESFFKTFKSELVNHVEFKTRAEARLATFEYIEVWYNRRRRHSSLYYQTPAQQESYFTPLRWLPEKTLQCTVASPPLLLKIKRLTKLWMGVQRETKRAESLVFFHVVLVEKPALDMVETKGCSIKSNIIISYRSPSIKIVPYHSLIRSGWCCYNLTGSLTTIWSLSIKVKRFPKQLGN